MNGRASRGGYRDTPARLPLANGSGKTEVWHSLLATRTVTRHLEGVMKRRTLLVTALSSGAGAVALFLSLPMSAHPALASFVMILLGSVMATAVAFAGPGPLNRW